MKMRVEGRERKKEGEEGEGGKGKKVKEEERKWEEIIIFAKKVRNFC